MTEDNQQYSLGGFGARLKTAREALQFSQKDVAMRLHLSPHIIQIIESEDLRQAPPATFMRGYLRSYAKLLNMQDEEINQAVTCSGLDLPPISPVAPMLMQVDTFPRSDRYVHWVTMLVLAISLVLVSIWWNTHSHETSSYATRNVLQNPSVPSTTNPAEVTQQPASVASTAPTSIAPSATQPPVAATTSTPPQTVATQATVPGNTVVPAPAPAPAPVANSTGSVAVTPTNPASVPPPTAIAGAQPTPVPPGAAPVVAPITTPPLAIMPPLAAASSAQQNVTQSVDSEPHRKHHRHSQDNNVSGMAMALPEPGLE